MKIHDPFHIHQIPAKYHCVARVDKITQQEVSKPSLLILHYTEVTLAKTLEIFKTQPVCAHYTLDKNGDCYQHVSEEYQAYHAGKSVWAGIEDVNAHSIGIENVNSGYTEDWEPFAEKQIARLIPLCLKLIQKYHLAPYNILGHSDIAPHRKIDPGPLFPWQQLAEAGVGVWYDLNIDKTNSTLPKQHMSENQAIKWMQKALKTWGYTHTPQTGVLDLPTQQILSAFQMHFRPSDFSGKLDRECMEILDCLLCAKKYPPKIKSD